MRIYPSGAVWTPYEEEVRILNSISVIMINKNRGFCLRRSITCVIEQLRTEDEIILIDDSSDDDSPEIMRSFSDRAILERCSSGGNRSLVRNIAARRASGDILLFLDSDVALLPGGLEHIRRAFDDPEVVGASGTTFGNDHDLNQFELLSHISIEEFARRFDADPNILFEYPRFFDYRMSDPSATADPYQNWKCYFGCFNAARADVYRSVGGFDEGFVKWGSEDIEFGYRLNRKGKIVYCRDAVVFHYSHGREHFAYARSNMENLYYFYRKHPSFETEVFCAFKLDANPTRMNSLKRMCALIAAHNDGSHPELAEGEAAICFPSPEHPTGCIKYIENGQMKCEEAFGFIIPVTDKRFERIYITAAHHALPDIFAAMLYQEALRAAHTVLLEKRTCGCPPIYFNEPGFYNGTPIFKDSIYICQYIESFIVKAFNEEFEQVVWHPDIAIALTGR